jgi:phenol/toluene 2-monooxygenase (NADH) P1/A1
MAELRQLVIEPRRLTYRPVTDRIGERPPTRYEEASIGVQSTENFHYRPLWDPKHELYDPTYSRLRLSHPDAYLDPRQFYYGSYVINRAQREESIGHMVRLVQNRDLVQSLKDQWSDILAGLVIPLRHYEAGANLISISATRFAWGTGVTAATGFAAMDRLANAQLLTEGGLTLGGKETLAHTKLTWIEDPAHQPARKLIEELLVEPDWAVGLIGLDLADRLIYPLFYEYLEGIAFEEGVQYFSLVAPFLREWYAEQRKWIAALEKAWKDDPEYGEANRDTLADIEQTWGTSARTAAQALAGRLDSLLGRPGGLSFVDEQTRKAQQ